MSTAVVELMVPMSNTNVVEVLGRCAICQDFADNKRAG